MENITIILLSSTVFILCLVLILRIYKGKFQAEIIQLKLQNHTIEHEKVSLQEQLSLLITNLENVKEQKFSFEKENEILKLQIKELKVRMDEWEIVKAKAIEHAKAAIFEAGGKLSSKLLEDHKREAEEAKKRDQLKYKEVTEELHKQFENIVKSVASLNDQVKDSRQTVDIVKQALLSPSGAGNLAEITLENILKNSGLISGVDYIMQYSFIDNEQGNKLRPDAIVFLPGNNLMVIDSKSSKFFTEIIQNEKDEIKEKLANSMRMHLKSLAAKNYQDAIKQNLNIQDKIANINHISMIMFLPSELALEKLREFDSQFMENAWELNIYPSGPIGIINILSHAKFQISQNNQAENYKIIIEEVKSLVFNLGTLYEHARKVGASLQSATVNFDKFAGTFNSKIVAKAKKLANLGVVTKSSKAIPEAIERYQLIASDKLTTVEAEEQNEELKQLVEN